jgi:uncharacterized membrane protein YkvA (DUF1232 family)
VNATDYDATDHHQMDPKFKERLLDDGPEVIDPEFDADAADGPSEARLLSFYDRLRARVARAVEERGGKLGHGAAEALLFVPDVFMLVARLALDKDVPKSTRALLGGALAYFILPVDLLPEAMLGAVGYTEDLILALTVLSQAFDRELEPYAARYWSGSRSVREVLSDVLGTAHALLGTDLYGRLRNLLSKRGIDLDEAIGEADGEGFDDGLAPERA